MAGKEAQLSIVLKTVDNATAGIRAINERIARITAPVRQLGAGLAGLAKEAGLPQLVDGFRGVGGAIQGLLGKVAVIGGVVAGAVIGMKSLVDEFDDLGDKAERLGVHVDFLAQLRFAAERSGASVEALDAGLQSFVQNLGQARAGTGRMAAFLGKVSPALLTQLKATKSVEEATLLMADAMAKLTDPTKKAALATKAGFGTELVPLLSKGARGAAELMEQFNKAAGSLQGAADGAGEVDDKLKVMNATTTGVKAALLKGLAPALQIVVDKLSAWFVAHREDIEKWATQIGERIPGAVESVVTWVGRAIDKVAKFVDLMGGLENVAIVVAGVIAGPLVASIAKLGVALLTNPIGLILTGIAAAAALIMTNWEPIADFFAGLWNRITSVFSKAWDFIKGIVDKIVGAVDAVVGAAKKINPFSGDGAITSLQKRFEAQIAGPTLNAGSALPAAAATEARVKVDFANAPRGTRVTADPRSTADIDLSVGYQLGAGL